MNYNEDCNMVFNLNDFLQEIDNFEDDDQKKMLRLKTMSVDYADKLYCFIYTLTNHSATIDNILNFNLFYFKHKNLDPNNYNGKVGAIIDSMHGSTVMTKKSDFNLIQMLSVLNDINSQEKLQSVKQISKHMPNNINLTSLLAFFEKFQSNKNLQKAVIYLAHANVHVGNEWNKIKDYDNLQKAVIALGDSDINLQYNWKQLKDNPNLLKAIVVAKESGFDFNTHTFDFLKKNESFCETLANNYNQILYITVNSEGGQDFKNSCQTLQKKLVQDVLKKADDAEKKGKIFNYKNEYSYQQLNNQTEMLTVVNDNQKQQNHKREALDKYESNAKKESSGWEKFGKAILTVVTTGFGFVAGAILGAVVGGAAGAAIGLSVPTYFFNRDSKKEKMNKNITQKGRNLIGIEN